MQLMPATAATLLTVDNMERALVDPATNVRLGSRHLRRLLDQYPGRLDLALAAYNAGEGAVSKYDGVPPYAETQQYVRAVTALYQRGAVSRAGMRRRPTRARRAGMCLKGAAWRRLTGSRRPSRRCPAWPR